MRMAPETGSRRGRSDKLSGFEREHGSHARITWQRSRRETVHSEEIQVLRKINTSHVVRQTISS